MKTSNQKMDLKQCLKQRESQFKSEGYYYPELKLKTQDPIKFEVFFTKMVQNVWNAREVCRLIAASPETREMGESVFGLYTPEGDAVCLSPGLMIHVHTISRAIKWMIENDYESEVGIREGDYFFNNDPYIGGGHAPDQLIVTPIFFENEMVGWCGGLTHVSEVGAVEPGGMGIGSTTRFHEGLFLPCVKIAENDEFKKDLEVLVDRNVRTSVWWLLDNRAKLAGNRLIRDNIKELISQYGIDYYREVIQEYIEDTRRATKEKIRKVLHPGRYREVGWRGITKVTVPEDQETLLHAPVELIIDKEGDIYLDSDGLSPAGRHPTQGTLPLYEGSIFNSLIQHVFFDLRYNEGTALGLTMNVPEGTACNPPDIFHATALWGPAFAGGIACNQAVSRAYYAKGYREEVHASNAQTSTLIGGGIDHFGRSFGGWNMEMCASGGYALAARDGQDTMAAEYNPEGDSGDAEVWEVALPYIYLGRSIRVDGGGFGKFRGGSGFYSLYMCPKTPFLETGHFGGAPIFTAPGLMGGYPAPPITVWKNSNTNVKELIADKKPIPHIENDPENPDIQRLAQGDVQIVRGGSSITKPVKEYDLFSQTTGDAGGFGDPIERNPELVLKDYINGLTTLRTAEKVYCVVINSKTNSLDYEATKELRERRRKERKEMAIPAKEYIQKTREKIMAGELPKTSAKTLRDLNRISSKFRKEYYDFWSLPEDFEL